MKNAEEFYLPLLSFSNGMKRKVLDNGTTLYIHLLKFYTGIQKEVFKEINKTALC